MTSEWPLGTGEPAGRLLSVSRRLVVTAFIALVLLQPAFRLLHQPLTGVGWFQLIGALVLTGLVCWQVLFADIDRQHPPWPVLLIVVALGIALFAVGGISWLASLAVSAGVCGRYSRMPAPAVASAAACAAAGLAVAMVQHYRSGNVFSAIVIAPLAGLLAYSAARRAETLNMLRRTRAELARAAVAEERLRIARDLHDLLGHSLSLITLKAELAGRVMGTDPDRAAVQIAELESVARQSLADVRAAVAGFRQPDLAAELVAAGQLFDAAGIASSITAPAEPELGQNVDAVLAWAVREGATNVVRHSRATHVAITVSAGPATAVAEISDNGPPADSLVPAPAGWRELNTASAQPQVYGRAVPHLTGSGLAGLDERVRGLGGELSAGTVQPHGFRLKVVVPVGSCAS
jgi:two-component system, NarL family, sensor histidine kinase DesK